MLSEHLPILIWVNQYQREQLVADLIAAVVVTIMLIPQSLAYAMLAGVPPEVGLYASILPLIAYAIFGSSRTLSVGPVAVASLMTAVALGNVAAQGSDEYLAAAIMLALLSGGFLLLMGVLRLGFLANFLSHTVVSGFISASGIIIALSQLKHVLGVPTHGDTLPEITASLWAHAHETNITTLILASLVLAFLFWARSGVTRLLMRFGVSKWVASMVAKAAPVVGVIATISASWGLQLEQQAVAVVGHIPSGLPQLSLPTFSFSLIEALWVPALVISIIGYVESVSVGKTLAAKRRQKIDMNQELIGLGAANVASAVSGAFPVTGGFSRSVVNFDAGAATQAASIFAAIGIALASLFLTPALYYLPRATLAATIIVAVLGLVDFGILKKTWRFSKSDFMAVFATLFFTLIYGVACGVGVSLALHLYRTSKPHIAEVGLVEGTQHFRNVRRFHVQTQPEILSLRVDESLFFANASYLEDLIYSSVYQRGHVAHIVLMCSAVNEIDFSALEVLEAINERVGEQGVCLHLSEVKGPVMDALQSSGFLTHLSGQVFLSQYEANCHLTGLYSAPD